MNNQNLDGKIFSITGIDTVQKQRWTVMEGVGDRVVNEGCSWFHLGNTVYLDGIPDKNPNINAPDIISFG